MKKIKCWCELESIIEVEDNATDEEIEKTVYNHLSDQFDWGYEESEDSND